MVIRKSKLPLERMTPLDKEAEIKRRKGEEEEKLAVLGQDSDSKAIPWVQKEVDNTQSEERNYFYMMSSLLKIALKKKKVYNRLLGEVFLHFARQEGISRKYSINLEANNIGLKMELKGTRYYGAFRTCGIPSYDFRAAQNLAFKLGNTIAKLQGHFNKTKDGIILPDGEDLKVYGH